MENPKSVSPNRLNLDRWLKLTSPKSVSFLQYSSKNINFTDPKKVALDNSILQ